MDAALLLKIISHLGTLVSAGKDAEALFADLSAGKTIGADMKTVLGDVANVLVIFPLPGVDAAVVAQGLAALIAVV